MAKYLLKRFLSLIPVAIVISILLFVIVKMVPGDPVLMAYGEELNSEEFIRFPELKEEFYNRKYREMGLDKSFF